MPKTGQKLAKITDQRSSPTGIPPPPDHKNTPTADLHRRSQTRESGKSTPKRIKTAHLPGPCTFAAEDAKSHNKAPERPPDRRHTKTGPPPPKVLSSEEPPPKVPGCGAFFIHQGRYPALHLYLTAIQLFQLQAFPMDHQFSQLRQQHHQRVIKADHLRDPGDGQIFPFI